MCLRRVGGGGDLGGHLGDLGGVLGLGGFKDSLVLLGGDEGDGDSLGSETTGTGYAMEVRGLIDGHIVVDDNVNALKVDTAAE